MQDKHYLDDWIHVPICQKGDKLYHYTTAEASAALWRIGNLWQRKAIF